MQCANSRIRRARLHIRGASESGGARAGAADGGGQQSLVEQITQPVYCTVLWASFHPPWTPQPSFHL